MFLLIEKCAIHSLKEIFKAKTNKEQWFPQIKGLFFPEAWKCADQSRNPVPMIPLGLPFHSTMLSMWASEKKGEVKGQRCMSVRINPLLKTFLDSPVPEMTTWQGLSVAM